MNQFLTDLVNDLAANATPGVAPTAAIQASAAARSAKAQPKPAPKPKLAAKPKATTPKPAAAPKATPAPAKAGMTPAQISAALTDAANKVAGMPRNPLATASGSPTAANHAANAAEQKKVSAAYTDAIVKAYGGDWNKIPASMQKKVWAALGKDPYMKQLSSSPAASYAAPSSVTPIGKGPDGE